MTKPSEDHFCAILANETAQAPVSVSAPPADAEFQCRPVAQSIYEDNKSC
jgi:hypothetical protein